MDYKEKWREVFTEGQLKRLQYLEFQELLVIKQICKKLGIKFFLYGGTLLGAYKYNGFIPWDDDVDVALSRKDYEVFIKEAPGLLPKDYILQNPYMDPKSPYSYTKLRLKGTRCIEEFNHELNIEQGIYIDIYPIDSIPDDDEDYKKQFNKIQRILSQIYIRQNFNRIKGKGIKSIMYFLLLRVRPINVWMNKLVKEMTRYNSTPCKRMSCWHYPNTGNYYEPLLPLKPVMFEGEEFLAPNDMEMHIRRRYGNIDELPPVEKRIGHFIHVLDFGKFENIDPQ